MDRQWRRRRETLAHFSNSLAQFQQRDMEGCAGGFLFTTALSQIIVVVVVYTSIICSKNVLFKSPKSHIANAYTLFSNSSMFGR